MATETTKLRLKKPAQDDFYDVGDHNTNSDKIDAYAIDNDARSSSIESKNIAQDTEITNIKTAATTLTARVTSAESKNTTQDALIGNLQTEDAKIRTEFKAADTQIISDYKAADNVVTNAYKAADTTLSTTLTSAYKAGDADIKSLAQMIKITNDSGGPFVTITENFGEWLKKQSLGLKTFYITGRTDTPETISYRGIMHKTNANGTDTPYGIGWVYMIDYNSKAYQLHFSAYTPSITSKSWKKTITEDSLSVVLPANAKLFDEFRSSKFGFGVTAFVVAKNIDNTEAYTFNDFPLTTATFFAGSVTKTDGSTGMKIEMQDSAGNFYNAYITNSTRSKWKTTYAYPYVPLTKTIPVAGHIENIMTNSGYVLDSVGTVEIAFTNGDVVTIPQKYGIKTVRALQFNNGAIQQRYFKLLGGNDWEIGPATSVIGTTFATTISYMRLIND